MKKDLDKFKEIRRKSPFSKSYKTMYQNFRYSCDGNYAVYVHHYEDFIPKFQRDNDKWTKKMQISFVENFLMGYKSSIYLFFVGEEEFPKWKILDGLQRLTALSLFISNELKVFGEYYYDDVKLNIDDIVQLELRMYRFKTEQEAVEFYISMNENISHSRKDIKRAKDYLASIVQG
jgi:uncharacterized protein with ParB-like and HNH nuclease domain